MDTYDVVDKLKEALKEAHGQAYAIGYLTSKLQIVIERYVTDKTELQRLHLEMLNTAAEVLLESKKGA